MYSDDEDALDHLVLNACGETITDLRNVRLGYKRALYFIAGMSAATFDAVLARICEKVAV